MSRILIAKYLTPWKYRREQEALRIAGLRRRDGDDCRRCRRLLRFDLPRGHDLTPRLEQIEPAGAAAEQSLENLCLTHRRCHAAAIDHTSEVQDRVRRRNEAALLSRQRKRKSKAA